MKAKLLNRVAGGFGNFASGDVITEKEMPKELIKAIIDGGYAIEVESAAVKPIVEKAVIKKAPVKKPVRRKKK